MTNELKQQAIEAIQHFDLKDAREIVKEIEYKIKEAGGIDSMRNADLPELNALRIRLKLLLLPILDDEEMVRIIKESAVEMVNDPDLVFAERVEVCQMAYPMSQRFDAVNTPIIAALHENNEQISNERIYVTGSKTTELSTVKNWFLDYDRTYGTQPQKDLTWLDYVKKNTVIAHLNTAEADTLRRLLKLYEWLKVPHQLERA